MDVPVDFQELLEAVDWVTGGESAGIDCGACVNRTTGEVCMFGDEFDAPTPDDIDDERIWAAVPAKGELDVGRRVALGFVEMHPPDAYEQVYGYFRRSGAFAHFRALLERRDQIDAWRRYEEMAFAEALAQWCEEHGFVLAGAPESDAS